jgi:hypothetical protein
MGGLTWYDASTGRAPGGAVERQNSCQSDSDSPSASLPPQARDRPACSDVPSDRLSTTDGRAVTRTGLCGHSSAFRAKIARSRSSDGRPASPPSARSTAFRHRRETPRRRQRASRRRHQPTAKGPSGPVPKLLPSDAPRRYRVRPPDRRPSAREARHRSRIVSGRAPSACSARRRCPFREDVPQSSSSPAVKPVAQPKFTVDGERGIGVEPTRHQGRALVLGAQRHGKEDRPSSSGPGSGRWPGAAQTALRQPIHAPEAVPGLPAGPAVRNRGRRATHEKSLGVTWVNESLT